jgi:hypothetical protein
MRTPLSVVTVCGFRLVARFVVLLVALSVMFDLMGQISVDYLEQEGPFEPDERAFSSALYLGMLNEDWGKGSLAGLAWHYMPAIVLSLSIVIAWTLIDIAWATKDFRQKAHINTAPLPHLPRLALRFVVLLVVLSFLFDLIGRTCFGSLELERPFVLQKMTFCSFFTFGMLQDALAEASLAGRLWHYLPAIVASLSIAILWSLVDRHRLTSERGSAKSRINKAPLSLLRRLTLCFAVLLFALATLYDFSKPLSVCFNPRSPILPETLPICFRTHFENWILMARKGGLPGLAWHYLPVAVVATIILIDWAWTHWRGRRK